MEMTISSVVTAIPEGCCGPRVLLIEPNKRLLELHAYVLSQNSYQVTSVLDTASGFSMIMTGHIFECVLVDVDREMDIVKFLNQILEHQPQPSIIMMASEDVRMRVPKEAHENEAVSLIHKPCPSRDISDYLQYICRKRIAIQDDHSNEQLPEENQALNITHDRVNPIRNPSEIQDIAMADRNILTNHSTQLGINVQETTGDATLHRADKGKKILEVQNEVVKDKPLKKRKAHQKRIFWTVELHNKFVEVVKELGKQNAIPSEIHKRMNVPGLTRHQVMSHLQNYREREILIKDIVSPVQRGNNWHVEKLNLKRSWQLTSSDDTSNTHLRPLRLNCIGSSFMSLDNIKAKLQEASALHVPLVTTTMNNFGGFQGTINNISDPFQPLMSATSMTTTFDNFSSSGQHSEVQMTSSNLAFGGSIEPSVVSAIVASDNNLAVYSHTFPNGFDNGNIDIAADGGVSEAPTPIESVGFVTEPWLAGGGGNVSSLNHGYGSGMEQFGEAMAPLDCFGITAETWVDGAGGTHDSSDHGLEDLTFTEFLPGDVGSICQSPDLNGNRQDLFLDFSPSTILSDYVPTEGIGSSTSSNLDYVPSEENNSQTQVQAPVNCIFGFDGSDGRVEDADPLFINLSPSDLETALAILNEVDAELINGPW